MLSDQKLSEITEEATRHPECVECRTILQLAAEVARLQAVENEWLAQERKG